MMFISILKKFLVFTLFLLIFLSTSYATKVDLSINESSSLKELVDGSYSLKSQGELKITNPSNKSKIYELDIPVELDSLIGLSKIDVDNSSSYFDFSFDEIKGYIIQPNETVKVGYSFSGLLEYNLYDKLENESIFEYYTNSIDLMSNTKLRIDKPEREGYVYNDTGDTQNSPNSTNTTRLLSAEVTNPTDFSYKARDLNIYRDEVGSNNSQNYQRGVLLKTFYNISLDPYEGKTLDFLDHKSVDNSIYWVSSDVLIDYNLDREVNRDFSVEEREESSGGGGGSSSSGGSFEIDDEYLEPLVIRKSTNKKIVSTGEGVKVSIDIVNSQDDSFENITILDEVPSNYELVNVSNEVRISGNKLEFNIDEIDRYSSESIEYNLINNEESNGVEYLQPAEMIYDGNSYFSDGILLVNNILPEKEVFVQKEVNSHDEEFSKVTLKVKNLGSTTLEDLLVNDKLDNSTLVKDISQVYFDEGTWKIKQLGPGEEWEVSYIAEKGDSNLENLPNVYGVDQDNLYGSIISSGEVYTIFNANSSSNIERVGLFVSIGLLVLYLLF